MFVVNLDRYGESYLTHFATNTILCFHFNLQRADREAWRLAAKATAAGLGLTIRPCQGELPQRPIKDAAVHPQ
eukprot:4546380-Amphidinium_carterae.1